MKSIIFNVILLLLIFEIISIESISDNVPKKKPHHFCGADYLNFKINAPISPRNKNDNIKSRQLLSTTYTPVRIFVDTTYLEKQAENIGNMTQKLPIIKNALNKAVQGIQKLLEVEQREFNIYEGLNAEHFINNSIYQWDELINDTKNMSLYYDYILVTRFEVESDGFPSTTVAAAMPILLGESEELSHRPVVGIMMVSKNTNFFEGDKLEKYLSNTFIHELTHAFGFLQGCFKYYPGGIDATLSNKTDELGITRYYIKTPKVVEFAKKYFNCESIEGIEVEDQGPIGSVGSHWEGRILLGEYMTSQIYEDEVTISEFTLALLEDTGWYKANYYTGGLFRFGKNKGCDFLNKYCLQFDWYSNSYYTFFNDEYFGLDMMNYPSCTTGRQSRAYSLFDFLDPANIGPYINKLPKDYYGNYYYFGGFIPSADFCPVNYHYNNEYSNSHFVGHCKIGNGNYGNNLYYYNSTGGIEALHPNSELPKELGEVYSDNSFCMMSNLIPNDSDAKTSIYGTIFHPMCYPSFCSSTSLTVLIYDQYIVCPVAGGNIEVKGYTGRLHCPDYNLICTGTVICNDLFDCIEKKSEPKETTYKYDYITAATQKYSDILNGNTYIGWESSDDGVCPKMCVQCLENKKCTRCLAEYNLIGVKENDDQPIICDNEIDVTKGYYLKDDIYYPCHTNCLKCSSAPISDTEMNCDECIEGLYYHKNTKNCDDIKEEESEEESPEPEEESPLEPEEESSTEPEEESPTEPEEEQTKEEEIEEEITPGQEEEEIPESEENNNEEEVSEEEEEKDENGNGNDNNEGNTLIIVIISIVAAIIIIIMVIIVFFYLKKSRVESDKIDTLMTDNRQTPLYDK